MFEGKIVAESAIAVPADVREQFAAEDARGSAALGLLILLVGLPLLAVRLFVWAVVRDVRRIGTLASIVGGAVADARRG